jgi:metallo-beta-lactamase class B
MIKNAFTLTTLAVASFTCLHTSAQKINEPPSTNPQWSQPYPPFRIVGNLYYVGTYDLACYLIVTPNGNILINTGLAASASMIKESIEALGFTFADTKILLTTQAHYDHVAAMATIKKRTGAKLMADDKDTGVLADGGSSGYELTKNESTFEPVKVDRLLKNGDTITLGTMRLVMLHHPGHTKGSCSFLFDVKDELKTYKVLIANLPTIVTNKKFSDIPSYPNIAEDYAYTLNAMKKLTFDIWLSSHAGQFELHTKHKSSDAYNPAMFTDQKGYDKSMRDLEAAYLKKMEEDTDTPVSR